MLDAWRDWVRATKDRPDDPTRPDVDDLKFEHTVTSAPGGGLVWRVWCDVDGQVVQAEAPTLTLAWERAIRRSHEIRRARTDQGA